MPTGGGTGGSPGGTALDREDREQIQLREEGRRFPGNTGTTKAGRSTYDQMRREGFGHENAASGAKAADANPRAGYFDSAGHQRPWPSTGMSFKDTFLHGGRGGY